MATTTAVIFLMKLAVPRSRAYRGRQSAVTLMRALTPHGCAMEITIARTSGMRAKPCVITKRAAMAVFAARQGTVFPCVGAVMAKMTVETAAMSNSVTMATRRVLVSSLLVGMV